MSREPITKFSQLVREGMEGGWGVSVIMGPLEELVEKQYENTNPIVLPVNEVALEKPKTCSFQRGKLSGVRKVALQAEWTSSFSALGCVPLFGSGTCFP